MNSCTDPLRLNEKRLFQELKHCLPVNSKETQNILEIRDNVLYVWNAKDYCVLTLNIAATRGNFGDVAPYQKLQPTDSPIFDVTNLLINETATQLALWGNLGIVLMDLPKRWGKDAVFQGGKEVIFCVVRKLDNFDINMEIRRARWHPGSTNDSHLLVLTSENTFCLYECELGNAPRLMKTWSVGRVPAGSPSKIPNFFSLGHTAVDFDFATPTLQDPERFDGKDIDEVSSSVDWNQIEWPILVLRGSGEVMTIRGNVLLDSHENLVILGPLSMYPPADDNYGTDSCSIMCIQTTPPIVVIAMCTGKIYHAILLTEVLDDDNDSTERAWTDISSNYILRTPEDALYVYECVEMELGFFYAEDDAKYNCPIHLHCDKGNRTRYFCSHNAGIHMITLPMVSQLEEYASTNDSDSAVCLPSLPNHSSSRYLICTRMNDTKADEPTPILGFGLLQEPCVLVALLHTGDVVDLSIIDHYYLPRIEPPEPIVDIQRKVTKEPFDTYIKNLLKHEASQPIIKIGSKSFSSQLQFLYRATQIFRKEHFARQDRVREEISKKVSALKVMKTHLLKELDSLMETKKELEQTAERLDGRYEEIKKKQEDLALRAKEVLRLVNYKEPSMTAIERAETEDLKKMKSKVYEMEVRLRQLKKKKEEQTIQLRNNESSEKRKEIVFNDNQEKTIQENLGQIARNIKKLIVDVKQLEEKVSI